MIYDQRNLPDNQGGVELEAIGSKPGVFKELDELLDVAFKVNIGQVWHHVGHHLGRKKVKVKQPAGVNCQAGPAP